MKWKKPVETRASIYAPGLPADIHLIDGFQLHDRLDTNCRAFLFVEKSTNDAGHGLSAAEIQEKMKNLRGRLPGVILVSEKLDIITEDVTQLILNEIEDVDNELKTALIGALKKTKGIVIGLYPTKGGVGLDTIARLLQLHLEWNKIDTKVVAENQGYGFHVVKSQSIPSKIEQERNMADCIVVIDPPSGTKVDRKILIGDQTAESVAIIKEAKNYDAIVINRFEEEVMPLKVFEKAVGKENLIVIPEIKELKIAGIMGQIESVPEIIRAELQAIYM